MEKNSYQISLVMGWNFVVVADDENEAIIKIKKYILEMRCVGGFTIMSIKAEENINESMFTITEYDGFIIC